MDKQNNIGHREHIMSGKQAPVYTTDKRRTKFTQRTNRKWIRLATVFGYMISVSMPAVMLSIYYTIFWDPQYEAKFNTTQALPLVRKERAVGLEAPAEHAPWNVDVDANPAQMQYTAEQKPETGQCQPCNCKAQQLPALTLNDLLAKTVDAAPPTKPKFESKIRGQEQPATVSVKQGTDA